MEDNKHQVRNDLCINFISAVVVGLTVLLVTLIVTWSAFGMPDWKTAVGLSSGFATYFFLVGK